MNQLSPKRAMIGNLQKNWNSLDKRTRKKICDIFYNANWEVGTDNWGTLYDKLTGGQRLRVVTILKHAGRWDSKLNPNEMIMG